MKKILIASLLVLFVLTSTLKAQNAQVLLNDNTGWRKIAKTWVDFKKDRDVVNILVSNRFAAIKFQVQNAPINLIEIEVFYSSGDNQKIKINSPIKAEGYSRVIDLNGGERNLKKIVFVYKTLSNRKDKKARLQVWGLKTNYDKK